DTVDLSNNVATTEFNGPGFDLTSQYLGLVTVSGVTNFVTNVRLKFGGVSCPKPPSLWFGAESPGFVYEPMGLWNEAPPNPISSVDLTFDDTALIPFLYAYTNGPTLLSGSYQPDYSIIANLL